MNSLVKVLPYSKLNFQEKISSAKTGIIFILLRKEINFEKKINIFFQTYFVTLFYKLVGLKEFFFYAALRIHYLNVKKKKKSLEIILIYFSIMLNIQA
jgi:ABC-type multidrug transport system permease subunit